MRPSSDGLDATWVFQGTVAEDATAGTHICTLTVTPATGLSGGELQLLYGMIIDGNTATAQVNSVRITDGTNILARLFTVSDTAASLDRSFPTNVVTAANTSQFYNGVSTGIIISGSMQLILQVSTAAVSVTQTFGVVCRIRGFAKPSAVLADTVGSPTLTVNRNATYF